MSYNTISINYLFITGCLEMKRGTAQTKSLWYNNATFSIRNGIMKQDLRITSLAG